MLVRRYEWATALRTLAAVLAGTLWAGPLRAQTSNGPDAGAATRIASAEQTAVLSQSRVADAAAGARAPAPAASAPSPQSRAAETSDEAGAQTPVPSPPTARSVARAPSGVVNLNTANAAELERLPGIGPARAKAILDLRARIAHFTRLEELLRVKGIGRATFRKLRPYLALEGETTLKE